MSETVYAFICKGIAGAPANEYGCHVTADSTDVPRPTNTWSELAYWMIVAPDSDDFPEVTVNIYYEGAMPTDQQRDSTNEIVAQLAGHLLFGTTFPYGPVAYTKQ